MDIPEFQEIDSLETWDTLVAPRRLQLAEFFRYPATARDAADHLGVPVTQLYYHINQMLEHGLLAVTATKKKGGMTERHFQVTAQSFRPSRAFFDTYGDSGLLEVIKLTFADAQLALQRSVEAGFVSLMDRDSDNVALGYSSMRLSKESLRKLVGKINELVTELPDDPDGIRVGGLIAIFPKEPVK